MFLGSYYNKQVHELNTAFSRKDYRAYHFTRALRVVKNAGDVSKLLREPVHRALAPRQSGRSSTEPPRVLRRLLSQAATAPVPWSRL
jgi:hypothetical protein